MISVLLVSGALPSASPWPDDLLNAGFHLLGAATWRSLVREAAQRQPQLVVAIEPQPTPEVFAQLQALHAVQPLPVLLFTQSPDTGQIDQAIAAGVAAHVVNGYAAARLRPLANLALARFRHEQGLRDALADATERYEERTLVDRAKGVLMRARGIGEDEAFRMLRVASMHANLRVGKVSQQVIDAARFAEAINLAGALRFLSQQVVKHAALALAGGPSPDDDALRIAQLAARGDQSLDVLGGSLSAATYGDLLEGLRVAWRPFALALREPVRLERLAELDGLAERVLLQAERLTGQLEHAGLAAPLRVVNLSGRQRMLSQRLAKQALLARLLPAPAAGAAAVEAGVVESDFARALAELEQTPLSTREIRAALGEAAALWARLRAVLEAGMVRPGPAPLAELRATSDALLTLFDGLTQRYEHSLQMLLG